MIPLLIYLTSCFCLSLRSICTLEIYVIRHDQNILQTSVHSMILSFELQLAQCATGFFSSCVTDIDFGHPLAVCLMCGITFLKIFLCPSFQEERPWDSVRYTSWNSTGQRVSACGHWRCRAQKPRGQVQLHGRPHCPEDWTWLEHCKVRSFFVRNSH